MSISEISSENHAVNLIDKTGQPRFWERGRWAKWGGKKPPMTPARTHAIAEKRRFDQLRLKMDQFASARELAAAIESGAARRFQFPVDDFLGTFECADTDLTPRHLAALGCVAAVTFGWGRQGLVGSHSELGELLADESGRGLKARRTGAVMRELVAWGYLQSEPTFRPYGAVTSRRGNVYQLSPTCRAALERGIARRRARTCAYAWQSDSSSGVPGIPEISSLGSEKNMNSPGKTAWQSQREAVSAAPTQIHSEPGPVPGGVLHAPLPGRRQDANRDTPRKAPDADGRERSEMLSDVLHRMGAMWLVGMGDS